jgi:hypothetical protein
MPFARTKPSFTGSGETAANDWATATIARIVAAGFTIWRDINLTRQNISDRWRERNGLPSRDVDEAPKR